MSRPLAWVLVVLSLGVFVAAAGYVLRVRADAGKGMPPYSIYSHDARRGAAEAAYVLRRAGWAPIALTRPVQYTQAAGLLVLVQPEEDEETQDEGGPVTDGDATAMLRWVEQGNTLLVLSKKATGVHRVLDLPPTEDATTEKQRFIKVALDSDLDSSSGYLRDIHSLSVGSESTLPTRAGSLPLWWVGDKPGAMVLRRGKGRVILVADPSPATYNGLWERNDGQETLRDDNVWFLVNVAAMDARDGKVYFDEYHHGFQSGGGLWGYLRYHGQHLLLLPLFLAVGAAVWMWAVRLGPAAPTPRTSEADAVDYASALARLYQQAGARRRLARTLARGFLGALTAQLRLRRNALPAEVLSAWRLHDPGPSGEQLQGLLRGAAALRKGDVTESELLHWSRAFDEFRQEIQATENKRMGLKKARRKQGG
jgi:hypothetical protein